jgi:hypothetical protein
MPIGSLRMPIVLELLFQCLAIVLLLTSAVSSSRYHREWKRNLKPSSRAPFRLPLALQLETSLFVWAAMICLAVATPDWRFRVFFGGVTLLGIGLTIYRLKSQSKQTPSFDESSVLNVGPTGTDSPL